MVKTIFFLWLLLLTIAMDGYSQQRADTLSLETCFALAKAYYPVLQQDSGLKRQLYLSVKNLQSRRLPDVFLSATGSYQSDVTQIPANLPGVDLPGISKDQYKAVLDIEQLIYDGGRIKKNEALQRTQSALLEQQQVVVFHQLKTQLSSWYQQLLIIQAKIRALQVKKTDLTRQFDLTKVAIQNGVSLPVAADELQVALLETNQQIKDQQFLYHGEIDVLSLVIGRAVADSTRLVIPVIPEESGGSPIHRPELQAYTLQGQLLQKQSVLLDAKNIPKVQLFAQSGYGRPGLNMLNNDFDWFYLAGVRLNWPLWDWHRSKRAQASIVIDQERVSLQQDNFLLQVRRALSQQTAKILSLESTMETDQKIVELQEKITETATVKLQRGTLTPTDYLIQLNKTLSARISRETHFIELQFAKYNYQLLKSN